MKRIAALLLFLTACATQTSTPKVTPTLSDSIAAKTAKMQKIDGYVPLYWDATDGRLLMEVGRFDEEMIYQVTLPEGVGSNPIGLDRGQLGPTHIVKFERIGPKVLMVEPNYKYRALTDNAAERNAVADSFAESVLAGFKVEASDGNRVLVDATDFFLSDAHGVAHTLRETNQGSYALDRNRSAIYLAHTKAFPLNTEVEATLTFTTDGKPGSLISSGVAPVPEIVTVREHHSLVALPPPGYKPRLLDPRVGMYGVEIYDYASPFTGPLEKRFITRHRLEKRDPSAAVSEPVKPIIYYLDNGVPEPIRSALLEGVGWWSGAFEAAGFKNAFIVKMLPDGADPMDIRYNMINWIHRSSRGWSFGESVIDPRTGEIIKGNVCLGSLRIRQDVMIAGGLVQQFDELHDEALAALDPKTSPPLMALARIRQLGAHEVGHTLGLDHNMAASSYGRASVMDYPAPFVKITDGKIDLSDAYATGIGAYDTFAIRYGYTQFPDGVNEQQALDHFVRCGVGDPSCPADERANPPMLFVKDADSRPVSGAHPLGSVWDGGSDPVAMLRHEMEVRKIALGEFGLRNLAVGEPLSSLEEKLLPLYLHHRYQLEAASKLIGGLYYTYAVKENGGVVPREVRRIVPASEQRDSLSAVLSAIQPSFLEIPQRILDLIPPRAYGYEGGIAELFDKKTAPVFDPVAAAMTGADLVMGALLDPRRDARLVEFHAEDATNPGLGEVTGALIGVAMQQNDGYAGAITRATRSLLATRLIALASDRDADAQVRAEATEALRRLSVRCAEEKGISDEGEIANRRSTHDDIERFLHRPAEPGKEPNLPEQPPGPPIGD